MIDFSFWKNRRVLITGNSGMKGTWMTLWLEALGAKVFGFSLEPSSKPNLFDLFYKQDNLVFYKGDVRNFVSLKHAVKSTKPELIIHMAAQAFVRRSYQDPLRTFSTNVMGTVNLLEAVKNVPSIRAVICVTSDKCYENSGEKNNFSEKDPLGGSDPYSASKGCAEIVVSSYRDSFYRKENAPRIASVRAGNIIGGGDWGEDRLIPDLVRAITSKKVSSIRNPHATRPWQHILDCLYGYLVLARAMLEREKNPSGAWNFASPNTEQKSVEFLANTFTQLWGEGAAWKLDTMHGPYEAASLSLDCSKANSELGWYPHLSIDDSLRLTVDWYRNYAEGGDMQQFTLGQITEFQNQIS